MSAFQIDKAKPLWGAQVRIRMYRVGLGDCFLLSVNQGGTIHHMLIDCGMFAGSRLDKQAEEKDIQLAVVQDIAGETNERLDVVVVTHEHMDHVSIFNAAKPVFDGITFSEAWFGWVESDTKAARDLREKYEIMEAHLAAALTGLASLPEAEKPGYTGLHDAVAGVAGFLGFNPDGTRAMEALGAAKEVKVQPRAAIDYVKQRAKKQKFGSPGDIWAFAGLKVYVLGPPPAEKQMRIMERAGATYDTALGVLGAANAPGAADGSPFGEQWQQPVQGSGASFGLDESVIDANVKRMLDRYLESREGWRRIDNQALDSAPTLALQMDKFINNTSLALAFELPPREGQQKGDVLLFPGDAQVGNWQWWFKIEKFDIADLLSRTVFYKVGHHGSHNATLVQALELMNHPDLVAMMPTNEAFARNSKHWNMPAPKLREELLKHACKRVLRNDQGIAGVQDDPIKDGEWGALKDCVDVQPLYIDFFVG